MLLHQPDNFHTVISVGAILFHAVGDKAVWVDVADQGDSADLIAVPAQIPQAVQAQLFLDMAGQLPYGGLGQGDGVGKGLFCGLVVFLPTHIADDPGENGVRLVGVHMVMIPPDRNAGLL